MTLAKLDDFVPADHPLRLIRLLVNEALEGPNSLGHHPLKMAVAHLEVEAARLAPVRPAA